MLISDFDPVEFLTDEECITKYLEVAAEQNDNGFFTDCLAQVARAHAINQLAESTGIERSVIFEMLAEPKNVVLLRTCLAVTPTEIAELVRI